MECPASDDLDIDGCTPLISSNTKRSLRLPWTRFLAKVTAATLCALLCFSFLVAVDATTTASSASQYDIARDDRFITDSVKGVASDSSLHPQYASLDPSAFIRWAQLNSESDSDGTATEFLDRLYQELDRKHTPLRRSTSVVSARHDPSIFQLRFWKRATPANEQCASHEESLSVTQKVVYGLLIPILVVLSGLFAGLTLGYMSLDETQLQVLALQGTPQQKKYAEKIMPIRKDGHLLLTTLLIANMITNETLPIIADPLLGGGVQAVIVSIVLVVIFAELIPQSVCSRYGLVIGAKLAPVTRVVIIVLWPIAWPVSRVLHYTLGAHSGIVYRRAELKELVNLHAASAGRGDLNKDTVTIVGGALDLQEKVVKQAMTPLGQVFMISIDSKLGYETLQQIVSSGHSRIPVYQEIEIAVNKTRSGSGTVTPTKSGGIFGALSRKTSVNNAANNKASSDDQRTLNGSIVNEKDFASSKENAANAKMDPTMKSIKRKKIVGALLVKQCVLLDPEDETPVRDMVINALPTVPADEPLLKLLNVFQEGSDKDLRSKHDANKQGAAARVEDLGDIDEEKQLSAHQIKKSFWSRHIRRSHHGKAEADDLPSEADDADVDAEAVATEMAQQNVPIGIITLEDVLEELIGEEILDEYDSEVEQNFAQISPPPSPGHKDMINGKGETPGEGEELQLPAPATKLPTSPKLPLPRFNFGRSNKDNASTGYFSTEVADDDTAAPIQDVGRTATSLHNIIGTPTATPHPSSPVTEANVGDEGMLGATRNKPILVRHQAPDGSVSTAIVGESLLRGRTASLAVDRNSDTSRSTTPTGSRGSRFKSTPLRATSVPANSSLPVTTPGGVHPLAQSGLEQDSTIASPDHYDDDDNHKQLGHQ